ncbi:MAG: hypothetical protein EOP24_40765 [Hyphomicrobiales bacterium]|nr:MAG: hypothetical protein EOP24_40765 [Hyphomicrobiales bacterium]
MKIRTVTGDIDTDEAGVVLPHEHLFINLMPEYRGAGLVNDVDQAVDEVVRFRDAGGGTIVDLTVGQLATGSVGRNVGRLRNNEIDGVTGSRPAANIQALQEVSRRSGVSVVAGTGHYREPYLDKDWFDRTSVDEIAEFIVADIEEGFPGTDARAGIIGEIGADKWFISAAEERSFRAAARAHRRTGITITTHAARWASVGWAQLKLLSSEQVPPDRIILGHVDTVPDGDYPLAMAKQGVYVQFDTFYQCVRGGEIHRPSLDRRIQLIVELAAAGYLKQVLLSQDVCLDGHLSINGGTGYSFILTHVVDELVSAGLSKDEVNMLLVSNPQRALAT